VYNRRCSAEKLVKTGVVAAQLPANRAHRTAATNIKTLIVELDGSFLQQWAAVTAWRSQDPLHRPRALFHLDGLTSPDRDEDEGHFLMCNRVWQSHDRDDNEQLTHRENPQQSTGNDAVGLLPETGSTSKHSASSATIKGRG
jgi:hypothetical protein